jgi:hypothetical protein
MIKMKRARFLSLAILCILCLSSIASFPIAKSQTEPIVSITQWHTSSPVIQPPATQEAHIPPIVRIVSPDNQTVFQTNNVTLTIDVASYFWVIASVYYKADWQDGIHQLFGILTNPDVYPLNASIVATFPQIPYGNHTLTIYVNTHDNCHSNATVTFATERFIEKPQPSSPFPVIAFISIISVVFGITICLVLYRRHRKTANLKQ